MRPRTLGDVVGQNHLIGEGRALRSVIESGHLPSMIFWGPPGTGKTTLAQIIAGMSDSHFETLSAVTSGVKDIRRVTTEARDRLGSNGLSTVMFIDEIHRFNKSQQDALLPHVEDGTITLIGATTENPSFEVIGPLLSRSRVFTLRSIEDEDIKSLLDRALTDTTDGIAASGVQIDPDALDLLTVIAGGDARIALDALELAAWAAESEEHEGTPTISKGIVEDALQRQARYDKSGDSHYDTISAFIKSIRASDPDAAVYWLARMIDAGEDAMFIARRLVISAAEDVGLADPGALNFAVSCQQGVHLIGMPEARILLAEATIYLASAPKSNSAYSAINAALSDIEKNGSPPVPMHLRNAPTKLMKELGHGEGYKYAHDFDGGFTETSNLPETREGARFYHPRDQGYEPRISERLIRWWKDRYK
ncbi:MAG: replication-associated recombination protein A [Chloroflexi bacterium]|nr:replication-associated recombination protein A [Chloroflexota bacterium]